MCCDQAKEYLSQKGLKFEERDIARDPGALADLKKLRYMTTPVIVIDDAVILGLDSAKIEKQTVDSNALLQILPKIYRPAKERGTSGPVPMAAGEVKAQPA